MFTWICPQCGREVPPSYTECPDCAAKAAGPPPPAPPQQPQAPPPPQQPYPPYPPQAQSYPPQAQYPPQYPQYPPPYPHQGPPPGQPPYPPPGQPPQQGYPQAYQQPVYQPHPYQQPVYQQPQYQPPPPPAPPQQAAPPPPPPPAMKEPAYSAPPQSSLFATPEPQQQASSGLPTWLLAILCTVGFVALFAGVYWLLGNKHSSTTPSTTVESPAARPGAATNPWQKFIEISAVRFVEDPKHKGKILAKFVVTNHSSGGLPGLAGNVTMWASTKKSEEDAQGTFSFITNLDAYESKEVTAPLTTKLKVYELPDWQNMTTDLQITAPTS